MIYDCPINNLFYIIHIIYRDDPINNLFDIIHIGRSSKYPLYYNVTWYIIIQRIFTGQYLHLELCRSVNFCNISMIIGAIVRILCGLVMMRLTFNLYACNRSYARLLLIHRYMACLDILLYMYYIAF